jgi:hypothetical protein
MSPCASSRQRLVGVTLALDNASTECLFRGIKRFAPRWLPLTFELLGSKHAT